MIMDEKLVQHLISQQFPQWKDLPIKPVATSGWDNKTFHLGEYMLVRPPSAASYANQVERYYMHLGILVKDDYVV